MSRRPKLPISSQPPLLPLAGNRCGCRSSPTALLTNPASYSNGRSAAGARSPTPCAPIRPKSRRVSALVVDQPDAIDLKRDFARSGLGSSKGTLRLCRATTTSRANLDARLRHVLEPGAETRLSVIAAGADVAPTPDREVYQPTLAKRALDRAECIAIEDSGYVLGAALVYDTLDGPGHAVDLARLDALPGGAHALANNALKRAQARWSGSGGPGRPARACRSWRISSWNNCARFQASGPALAPLRRSIARG